MRCDLEGVLLDTWDESNKENCPVDYCKQLMNLVREASCGKCVLCREGTWQAYKIIEDISIGQAKSEDYEFLLSLLEQISHHASCDLAQQATWQCMKLIKTYEEEWDKHILRKRCSNLVCKSSYTLYIDPQLCQGCGICYKACEELAIEGAHGMIHLLNHQKCNKCMECIMACPNGAIKKTTQVNVKVPTTFIPVGSFVDTGSELTQSGMKRKRRRE